jgi:hypothetical protein
MYLDAREGDACKIVRDVEFSGGPDKIELLLFDSVFHPPVAHIKGF